MPESVAWRLAWDTSQGLAATAEKPGIDLRSFLVEWDHEAEEIPPLSEIIAQKAVADPRPPSWVAA